MEAETGGDAPARLPARVDSIWLLDVFVSSSLGDLAAERAALRVPGVVTTAKLRFYEDEVDAALDSHRDMWRAMLAECDLYLGMYKNKLGEWTLDEYQWAREELGLERALYVWGPYEWPERDATLQGWLASLGDVDRQGTKYVEPLDRSPETFAAMVADNLVTQTLYLAKRQIGARREVRAAGRSFVPTTEGLQADPAPPGPAPAWQRRPGFNAVAPPDEPLIGRDELADDLQAVFADDAATELIALVGEAGAGKTALLGHLGALLADQYPDGIVAVPGDHAEDTVDDLTKAVFDAFYEPGDKSVEPPWTQADLVAHLDGSAAGTEPIRAVALFEDVAPGAARYEALRKRLPAGLAVCITTSEAPGAGFDVEIPGLAPSDVVPLFTRKYPHDVSAKAAEWLAQAAGRVGNLPGSILKLASRARMEAKPADAVDTLEAWARAKAEGPVGELLAGGGAAREAVRALVAAGGQAPAKVVNDVAGRASAGEALAHGDVRTGSPRYVLAAPVPLDLVGAASDERLMGAILESAVDWAETARLHDIRADRAFVIRTVRWAVAHDRHAEAIRLARATDPAFSLGTRWGSWERLLELARDAAVAAGDRCAEAWANHQLGTRAMMLGDDAAARPLLARAVALRERHCSPEAAALSRHNLPPAPPPPPPWGWPWPIAPILVIGTIVLLWAFCGGGGGPADFEVPFGRVQVPRSADKPDLLWLEGPDAYNNDRPEPRAVVITIDGDDDFCVGIAGIGPDGGRCILRPGGTYLGFGRAPPGPPLVPGMPLAQAAPGGDCALSGEPGSFELTLTVVTGPCTPLFGFEPPSDPDRDRRATVRFADGRDTWVGTLTGSTFGGDGGGVLAVTKQVDADADGSYADEERLPAAAGEASFLVRVTNLRQDASLEVREIVDNRYGVVATGEQGRCPVPQVLEPGRSLTCDYDGPVAAAGGDPFVNVVGVRASYRGELYGESASASVRFTGGGNGGNGGDGTIEVDKLVDADGDGEFASAETLAWPEVGAAGYRVDVRNAGASPVTIAALADSQFGDLGALDGSTCATGTELPPGGSYSCTFAAALDPTAGPSHRNTVAVTVDPAGGSPYEGSAVVAFPRVVVTKAVDADGDGTFSAQEALVLDATGADRPFRVRIANHGPRPVGLAALVDSEFGDLAGDCAVPATIGAGEVYACEFARPIAGGTAGSHTDTVTATVVSAGGAQRHLSNRVDVSVVGGPQEPVASLAVDADGDGTFGARETAPEGGERPVEYEVAVVPSDSGGVTLGPVVVSIGGADVADCPAGAQVSPGRPFRCAFSAEVGGNAGDTVTAELDAGRLGVPAARVAATVEFVDVAPSLELSVTGPPTAAPGEQVAIQVDLRNTSVVTDDVTLTALTTGSGVALAGLPQSTCRPEVVTPGDTLSCEFDVPVTAAAGGTQSVTVRAAGVDDENRPVEIVRGHTIQVAAVAAGVEIVKSAEPREALGEGVQLTYRFTVLNIGEQELRSVRVVDGRVGFAGICGGRSVLAPGASTSCTAGYTVTAADVAAGEVRNRAEVTAVAAVGGRVADADTVVVPVFAIGLSRPPPANADEDASGTVTVGDTLTFTYELAVPRPLDQVTVVDSLPVVGLACTPPGGTTVAATMRCTARYVVTAADADAGRVSSTARAFGRTAAGQTVDASASLAVPVATTPSLIVALETDPSSGADFNFEVDGVTSTLRDGGRTVLRLPGAAGVAQVVAEATVVPEHWRLVSLDCDDGDSITDLAGQRVTARVAGDETVTCTFRYAGQAVLDAEPELVALVDTQDSSTVTVTNVGAAAVSLLDLAAPAPFAIDESPATRCSGARLEPGSTCTFSVRLAVDAVGTGFVDLARAGQATGDVRVLLARIGP